MSKSLGAQKNKILVMNLVTIAVYFSMDRVEDKARKTREKSI